MQAGEGEFQTIGHQKRTQQGYQNKDAEVVLLITTRPCASCGCRTHGWGMVTDIFIRSEERYKRVCSRACNEKFYTDMYARIPWVKGFIPHKTKTK